MNAPTSVNVKGDNVIWNGEYRHFSMWLPHGYDPCETNRGSSETKQPPSDFFAMVDDPKMRSLENPMLMYPFARDDQEIEGMAKGFQEAASNPLRKAARIAGRLQQVNANLQHSELQQQVDLLQQENADLQQQMDPLQQMIAELQHTNANLQQQKDLIQQQKDLLQHAMDDTQQANADLQQQKDLLQQANAAIQQQKDLLPQTRDEAFIVEEMESTLKPGALVCLTTAGTGLTFKEGGVASHSPSVICPVCGEAWLKGNPSVTVNGFTGSPSFAAEKIIIGAEHIACNIWWIRATRSRPVVNSVLASKNNKDQITLVITSTRNRALSIHAYMARRLRHVLTDSKTWGEEPVKFRHQTVWNGCTKQSK